VLVAGIAGLVAGAMSMAAGEYVSVSSQRDAEQADLERERRELEADPVHEHAEMAAIYRARGLDATLAKQVATQLMAHDALGAHARDELGMVGELAANPVQAALASAASFAVGAALPLLAAWLAPDAARLWIVSLASLLFLAVLGAVSARTGGSSVWTGMRRVLVWGAVAMAITAAVGALFGVVA
jgi:VIT1/CCC1 family predicted Fe2+/Mn2+ transporter